MASARGLGPFERYFLSRSNVGFPPVMVFVAFLAAPLDHQVLIASIKTLLVRYPMLGSHIAEPTKPFPRWAINATLDASDIIEVLHKSPPELPDLLSRPATIDLATGPLWQVKHYVSDTPMLVFHIHHIISDGVGCRNLLVELFQLIGNPSKVEDATPTPFPPTLEATVDVRPFLRVLLYNIFVAVVLPLFPAFLRRRLAPTPVWPNPPRAQPRGPSHISVIRIPPEAVNALSEAGKRHDVRTFHPLLTALALHATWAMAGHPDELISSNNTPASERDAARGHPQTTGNFVASFSTRVILTPRRTFWPLARELAASLSSSSGRVRARSNMGMLGYIPKPDTLTASGRTGWDEHLGKSIFEGVDFAQTFGISNLGLFPPCPGVKEVVWAQEAFPGQGCEAFCLDLITTTDGPMYITMNWREGVLDGSEVGIFKEDFERLVELITRDGIAEDANFKDITSKM